MRFLAPAWRSRKLATVMWLSLVFTTGTVAPSAGQDDVDKSSGLISFNLPPQPLGEALDAYARETGMAALVDQHLVAGRRSSGVRGLLTADQALRILLAGTMLSVRYASPGAFTLEPAAAMTVPEPRGRAKREAAGRNHRSYFADLQEDLAELLCRRPETRPGGYRLGLQLWIGPAGTIMASHLLASTGDDRRDDSIRNLLGSAKVAAPPPALPQPVTLILMSYPADQSPDCRPAEQHVQ